MAHRRASFRSSLTLSIVACALSAAGCGPKKKSAIVLWVATDMPRSALATVRVTAIGQGGATPMPYYENREFRVGATGSNELPLPGSLALTKDPSDQSVTAEVVVDVSPTMGNGTPFQVKAKARFVANEWRQLELFLPYQCTDENVRRLCAERSTREGVEYTCGALGPDPCILVERSQLNVFEQDAGTPSSLDVQQITTLDASMDAAVDAQADSGIDARSDTGVDTGVDVRPVMGAPLPSVTHAWPQSAARFSGGRPTLVGKLPADCMGANGLELVLCPTLDPSGDCVGTATIVRDATFTACAGGAPALRAFDFPATTTVSAGNWSWSLRLAFDSATVVRRGPIAWRRMSIAATVAGATATSHLGAAPDFDEDGRGDVFALPGRAGTTNTPQYVSSRSVVTMASANMRAFEPATTIGTMATPLYGADLLSLGDADGDGTPDALITDYDGASGGGALYRYSFDRTLSVPAWVTTTRQPVLSGPSGSFRYGQVLAHADFDRDGFPDIVAGDDLPMFSALNVHYGSSTGFATSGARVASLSTVTPRDPKANNAVANCDVNGDGYPDLVTALHAEFSTSYVAVYLGGASGLSTMPAYEINDTMGTIGSGFGVALACNGDFNGDGRADIAIGSSNGETMSYGVIVYAGGATLGMQLYRATMTGQPSGFGESLEFVGDQDGMPGDELAIGESDAPSASLGRGQIKLVRYNGGSPRIMATFDMGTPSMGEFGRTIRFLGPIGPMGQDGFAVAAPSAAGDFEGRVVLFYRGSGGVMGPPTQAVTLQPDRTYGMGAGFGSELGR
ncbi:MAG: VCBS repeat-containing protein [Myxococcales bacterium]|nr:VCBS repeat-containing protein [Myxococcales bacterium]